MTGNTPDLLGIRLEKSPVEPCPESVRDPILEGAIAAIGKQLGLEIARYRKHRVAGAEPAKCIQRTQGVVEKRSPVENPRAALAYQEVVTEHLVPHPRHRCHFGKKTVPADIEQIAVVTHGA